MGSQSEHFRHILLFYFRKGVNASKAHKKLWAVYGDEALKERQCQNWFARFRSGDFSLQNEERSGRPVEVDDEQIKALIVNDRHSSTRDIAKNLDVSHTCIENHLRRLGYQKKLDAWVPHNLGECELTRRLGFCDMLLKRNASDPFLKRMVTGDEKWIVYNNISRKRSWSRQGERALTTSKGNIYQKKVLLSVWWDYKGVVYFELLPRNQTINSEVYVRQLTNLNYAIQEKRPELANRKGIVFHHNNARLHTSLDIRQKLLELGWDVLPHPPYSPDLAPSDYHLFRSLQNFLNGQKFQNDNEVKTVLDQFFATKTKEFYEKGIMILPEKWQKVIDNNGHYIVDKNNLT